MPDQTLTGIAGIPSEEALGSGTLAMSDPFADQTVVGEAGIPVPLRPPFSRGQEGQITIYLDGASGIGSGEAFGLGDVLPDAVQVFGDAGIPSAAAFGAGGSVDFVTPPHADGVTGIPTAEAFGLYGRVFDPALDQVITGLVGIPSGEAFTQGPCGVRINPFSVPRAVFVAY